MCNKIPSTYEVEHFRKRNIIPKKKKKYHVRMMNNSYTFSVAKKSKLVTINIYSISYQSHEHTLQANKSPKRFYD